MAPYKHKDWETKEELRENLADADPTVMLALLQTLGADLSRLPGTLPREVTNTLPPGGKVVVGIAISQAAYDAIPDPSKYSQFAFFITED